MALNRMKGWGESCEAGIREVLVMAAHTAGVGMVGIGRSNTLGGDGRAGNSRGMSAKATGQHSALGEARGGRAARGFVDWRSRAGATKAGARVDAAKAGN